MITILTPTYNRGDKLGRIYDSLINQTNKNFEWLIVDDGSTDNTKEIVDKFISEKKLDIKYIYKKNGGKHTALNVGNKVAKGELIINLDSDDYFTNDAVELIEKYWDKYKSNKKLCGITFMSKIDKPIYEQKPFEECVSNMIEFKYNKRNLCDMCEVLRKDLLLEYPYPEFEGERFLSEVIVTGNMAKKYDMVYVPIPIYIAEYLDDGLSKNWLKNVTRCPNGARANSQMFMDKAYKFDIRLKNCIEFGVFSFLAKKKIIKDSPMKFFSILFYIPCYFVSLYLRKKYSDKKGNR